MATVAELFALALQYHRAGNLHQAEQFCRDILRADPRHAEAHHLVGVIAYQSGRFDLAITALRKAISLDPRSASYHSNLGLAHDAVGQFEEAVASYRQALRLQPNAAQIYANLGNTYLRQGQQKEALAQYGEALRLNPGYAEGHFGMAMALGELAKTNEAVVHFRQALRLNPHYADAHNNLANVLLNQGKLEDALAHCREALSIHPDFAEARTCMGNVLLKQGKTDEAVTHFELALRSRPSYAQAHNDLGNARLSQGNLGEAIRCYRQALGFQPRFAEACNNLAGALTQMDHDEEAVTWYREALRLKPNFAQAHYNLGNALERQQKFDEAINCHGAVIELQAKDPEDPVFAAAHWIRSLLWLLLGDFERGWPEYEWRWARPGIARPTFAQPLWDGSSLNGRTVLLYAEQGLGDTLQFIRYAPLVQQRGGKVIVECQPPLVRLLASAPGIDRLLAHGSELPKFDVQAPLLSLPGIFHTSGADIPATVPYLQADPFLVQRWQRELEPLRSYKIGIAWQGSPAFSRDRQRSIPLINFARLASLPGVQLVSLQKGPGTDQLLHLAGRFHVLDLGSRLDEESGPFMDTAAVVKCMDLVISSDTAVPHLAGALGVPVWVALPLVPDWRWLLHRQDSPWYPTMRLFRQTRYNDWDDVFERMAKDLLALNRHGIRG